MSMLSSANQPNPIHLKGQYNLQSPSSQKQHATLSLSLSLHYRSVFGSAVLCLQNVADADDDVEAKAAKGQEEKLQQQQQQPIAAASSEDDLEMEVEAEEEEREEEKEEEEEEEGEESRQMIEKTAD